ncbi:MAG: hypothetical protein ABI700_23060 [Chloroflexota bacterium]
MRKASRLYDSLVKGETGLLVEHFPFIEGVFTVTRTIEVRVPAPVPEKRKLSLPPPKVTYRARSEEDDLRDALDIGFSQLTFEPLEDED